MCDEKPQPGDLIEIFRGSYQHWAVYVGDGFVVHMASPSGAPGGGSSSSKSIVAEKALVKKEELCSVVGTDRWRINNSLDEKYEPHPAGVIVGEACALVGEELPYGVFTGNCEHFANVMRYGRAESRQVRDAALVVAVGVGAGLALGALSSRKNKNTK
ncbi:phospholipase A and acyltransferase 3-like [Antennarius striatus]|uniref:phospholipase A and acyltransferase 3-like n=1 Tax=Antennarius striatus TaxID=241820 RepID=UPI0035B00076